MKKVIVCFSILCIVFSLPAQAQFEKARDSVIQLFGVVMTSDSLDGIPAVSVVVKGSKRGTISNGDGVFSIAVLKGDEIEFSHVSYKPFTAKVPRNLEGNQYSIVQLMVKDTAYLPVAIIRPRPTKEQFARDFVNVKVAEDEMEIIRKNNTPEMQAAVMRRTSFDGREMTNRQLDQVYQRARYQGQVPPMNIFNPAAWAEFINSWKRGDFKNK
ncbi:MAG: carboxypeptidase-like regulatory domain-containing protein [Niabella sp.]